MDFIEATASYEAWLGQHVPLIADHLRAKHRRMAQGLFPFLRATFYRWAQHWPACCPELAAAPRVLAVGDLHLENFGTWRDREGRLIWGVNDFDEALPAAYTLDLVRLAASVAVAARERDLPIKPRAACRELLCGYHEWLLRGGGPFVLTQKPRWLWELARAQMRAGAAFWDELRRTPLCARLPFEPARRLLDESFPEPGVRYRVRLRQAGLGSLGRPRYVALARWRGGVVAREVKALTPTAGAWADPGAATEPDGTAALMARAVRCPDEHVRVRDGWIVRRLAPDFIKIELAALPVKKNARCLLRSMGRELANIHLGTPAAVPAVLDDLQQRDVRDPEWLPDAARAMVKRLRGDWKQWRRHVR